MTSEAVSDTGFSCALPSELVGLAKQGGLSELSPASAFKPGAMWAASLLAPQLLRLQTLNKYFKVFLSVEMFHVVRTLPNPDCVPDVE